MNHRGRPAPTGWRARPTFEHPQAQVRTPPSRDQQLPPAQSVTAGRTPHRRAQRGVPCARNEFYPVCLSNPISSTSWAALRMGRGDWEIMNMTTRRRWHRVTGAVGPGRRGRPGRRGWLGGTPSTAVTTWRAGQVKRAPRGLGTTWPLRPCGPDGRHDTVGATGSEWPHHTAGIAAPLGRNGAPHGRNSRHHTAGIVGKINSRNGWHYTVGMAVPTRPGMAGPEDPGASK